MSATNIAAVDLNLLKAFEALLRERSVTRAAVTIGVSQPAMSHSLTRLRHLFGDELFVRLPHGMEPTPKAHEIGMLVEVALDRVRAEMQVRASRKVRSQCLLRAMARQRSSVNSELSDSFCQEFRTERRGRSKPTDAIVSKSLI